MYTRVNFLNHEYSTLYDSVILQVKPAKVQGLSIKDAEI